MFVVDDDPGMLRGVQRLLREHGYDSVSFPTADAFQRHDDFDQAICVVLDIDLNDDSGIEVRHRLKAAGIALPVIYITGKDRSGDADGGDGIRMSRLSHQALRGQIADRADRAASTDLHDGVVRSFVDILLKVRVGRRLADRSELVERQRCADAQQIGVDDLQLQFLPCFHLADQRRIGAVCRRCRCWSGTRHRESGTACPGRP